jgi:hypothetical protein
MWFRKALVVFHNIIAIVPWIVALFVSDPTLLLLFIAIELLVMVQWVVLGYCVLSPLENNGSTNSAACDYLAELLQIPVDAINKGIVVVNCAAPCFLTLSRIAGALGV